MIPNQNCFFDKSPSLLQCDMNAVTAPISHHEHGFNPYVNNAGNVLAIGAPGLCIIAGDTRLSVGYSVLSRDTTKIEKLTENCVIATSGMYADFNALTKYMHAKLKMYDFNIGRQASTKSVAQLLSTTLYGKRFFPYYTFNIVAGLDDEGNGITYGYDAIGSFEPSRYMVQGSAKELMLPILDNLLVGYNKVNPKFPETKEQLENIVKDVFNSVAERDIYTGDKLEIVYIEKDKVTSKTFDLRKD